MKKEQIIKIMKEELQAVTEADKKGMLANIGNLFIKKDPNGHISLYIGGRSGQINLGYAGTPRVKEFIKILKDYGSKR
jgi:hypothetical protein